jgi:hypothetical protein
VAGFTVRGKLGGDVVGHCRRLKNLRVTGVALRRESLELACSSACVASRALNRRVRSDQREPVFVRADRLHLHVPSEHGVTLLAVGAELSSMNVSVAIRALRSYIAEYRFGVAVDTSHLRMHAAQGVTRLVVIKFGNRPDRLPTRKRVAILAGDREGAMRTTRLRGRRTTVLRMRRHPARQQDENKSKQWSPRAHEFLLCPAAYAKRTGDYRVSRILQREELYRGTKMVHVPKRGRL